MHENREISSTPWSDDQGRSVKAIWASYLPRRTRSWRAARNRASGQSAQLPRPPMPLSTLQETPRDVPGKTRGQDGFATSFPVGLLHPLQHAGLSRRSPGCPSSVHNRTDRIRSFERLFFGLRRPPCPIRVVVSSGSTNWWKARRVHFGRLGCL